ncbi:MAG: 4Fe-4S dicluster-binding protein [Armatimonadota bacterium]|nr:4Fe-4S dicluster-binding protein [Armatimonadota bacterium]MDR7448572.1 4Fe-4S dicluster-binding protein [Armatimonadota bacterium]MDR7458938.1 4Fe-4S dicluster-binding protein [Armatimonadota bacterium]MDR7478916.1 4Fe-4S dicluster-binding protein [Armatimonadota bacterium]MDR7489539.1 4Fe-4S dicluster-binding protein [Armatimonadota bacterium]
MATYAVEVVYRGIFQKTLAKNITRGIVLAAVQEGKTGIAFGRYGDSPERNGIPAKNFAIVADDAEELEASMAQYEPKAVDITIAVDDTLCKGVESWAWYGLQPINRLTKPGGYVVVTTMLPFEELLTMTHAKGDPYHLAVVRGLPSFSGLWVYKDDHTDVRMLGAIARLKPELLSLAAVEAAIREEWGDELKVLSARRAHERVETLLVPPGTGNPETPYEFELPRWWELREGLTIPAIRTADGAAGEALVDPATGTAGGWRPARNPYFKKFTTRTMRPVVDFDTCVKCTLCWLQCPDSCFDVTPDGFYDANLEACCGCGVCEAVCPVANCITMVNEAAFTDHRSQWEMWKADPAAYKVWVQEKIRHRPERSHGFRYRGQYQEQIQAMVASGVPAGPGQEALTEQVAHDTVEPSAGGN